MPPRFINNPAHQTLVRLLKEVRLERGLSQVELAERLKTRQAWVSLIEVGQRRVDVAELLAVLQAIEADPKEFWDRYMRALKRVSGGATRKVATKVGSRPRKR